MDVLEILLNMLALLCGFLALTVSMPAGIAWGLVACLLALLAGQAQASCHHADLRRWSLLLVGNIMRLSARTKEPPDEGEAAEQQPPEAPK
jgi:hypothetical protein